MEDISNKTVAMLLVVSLVISLAGTFFAIKGVSQFNDLITGAASATGTAKINVTESAIIFLTQSTVDFGAGFRNASAIVVTSECNLTTNQSAPPACWINNTAYAPSPFKLRNDGNVYVNITINSSTATSFLTGTPTAGVQRYMWTASDSNEGKFLTSENGCVGTMSGTDWTAFSAVEQMVCTNMSPYLAEDEFNVDINISIPAGIAGNYTTSVYFYGVKSAQ